MLALAVDRPADVETTAKGAAMLAAVGCGLHPSLERAAAAMGTVMTRFTPAMAVGRRTERLARWDALIARQLAG